MRERPRSDVHTYVHYGSLHQRKIRERVYVVNDWADVLGQ